MREGATGHGQANMALRNQGWQREAVARSFQLSMVWDQAPTCGSSATQQERAQ